MFTIKAQTPSGTTALAQLQKEILSGDLAPGEHLAEIAIAERLDVSRGPVREALRRLAEQGLVTFTPYVGAKVRELSASDARALYEVREALEAEAARLAARRIDEAGRKELRATLSGHARAVAAHPAGAYLQGGGDADFHDLLARLCGNPVLRHTLAEGLGLQLVLLRRQHRKVEGRGRIALLEHERIAEAVIEGDAELAGILMRRHIRASRASLESQIEGEGKP